MVSAAAEEKDPQSILSFYRRLVQLRKELPIIAAGDIRFIDSLQEGIIAYERQRDEERLAVLCNLTDQEQPVPLDDVWKQASCLIDSCEQAPQFDGNKLILKPYEGCALITR